MIECKKCGAQLDINTKRCPYCGEINSEAIEHIEKMEHFEKDYRDTKKEVFSNVKTFSRGYGDLLLLIILLISTFITLFVISIDPLNDGATIKYYKKHQAEIDNQIAAYITNGDFEKLDAYMRNNNFVFCLEEYDDYYFTNSLIKDYKELKNAVIDYHLEDSEDDFVKQAARAISSFYDSYYDDLYEETSLRMLIKERLEGVLKTYLYLKDEDIAMLNKNMNESSITKSIFERLEENEKNS